MNRTIRGARLKQTPPMISRSTMVTTILTPTIFVSWIEITGCKNGLQPLRTKNGLHHWQGMQKAASDRTHESTFAAEGHTFYFVPCWRPLLWSWLALLSSFDSSCHQASTHNYSYSGFIAFVTSSCICKFIEIVYISITFLLLIICSFVHLC